MSILIVLRNDCHATARRGRVEPSLASLRIKARQKSGDQGMVHAADERRKTLRHGVEGTVPHSYHGAIQVGLVPEVVERLHDRFTIGVLAGISLPLATGLLAH